MIPKWSSTQLSIIWEDFQLPGYLGDEDHGILPRKRVTVTRDVVQGWEFFKGQGV